MLGTPVRRTPVGVGGLSGVSVATCSWCHARAAWSVPAWVTRRDVHAYDQPHDRASVEQLAHGVAGARVTKGALYHHFTGKQALFESVFGKVEDRAARDIHTAVRGHQDPWDKAMGGLRADC